MLGLHLIGDTVLNTTV